MRDSKWLIVGVVTAMIMVAGCSSSANQPTQSRPKDAQQQSNPSPPPAPAATAPRESGITLEVKGGGAIPVTQVIKPGETAALPNGTIAGFLHFPVGIDWYSVKVRADGRGWHREPKNRVPVDTVYYFVVYPDAEADDQVTITLEAVNDHNGIPLLNMPVLFRIQTSGK